MKPEKIKLILIGCILSAGLFDVVTLLIGSHFKFEANPLYHIAGNIWMPILYKFSILGLYSVLLWRMNTSKQYWVFTYVFMAVTITLAQILGGYTNLLMDEAISTGEVDPVRDVPEPSYAMSMYMVVLSIVYLYPLGIGLFVFFITNHIVPKNTQKVEVIIRE